ncbi:hypothetical protein CLAFUW4_13961 [Fulvia fulva]|uniref:Uncharacterized protein n=1 Tax=Passalora fulva TaxID=5499 RepID=A0A9Q8UWA0_PASFU|nr:uncharacterized protein CLAFUR5_13801 [Fulvia fulva]KAK4610453.1 hypothetical protein CLAFUR4_13964 [Fulvia fulva]KAK4611111.1 hypothetical protein CLAFUR0_13968 [Fulvia fulva]UJO24788.1 hypothetical protein CLAFUR5_13801 [Fulvia fulva]WPV21889.1 hypothetical protein CLAFUW4_13961 [Fulvia fulva]WPV36740.1 hypothetical protein CLAFUW7_13969 [Fulvia fulva]
MGYEDPKWREYKQWYEQAMKERVVKEWDVRVVLVDDEMAGDEGEGVEEEEEDEYGELLEGFDDLEPEEQIEIEERVETLRRKKNQAKHNLEERLQDQMCNHYTIGLGAWKVPKGQYRHLQQRHYRNHMDEWIPREHWAMTSKGPFRTA